eukprot:m.65685 g.65685  ORF g.65685 m.65685 type:complete len:124 (+) comp23590_c0_seq2:221-592(+)
MSTGEGFFAKLDTAFCGECGSLLPEAITSSHVTCDRCKVTIPAASLEGVKLISVSREYAFQKPKFDTNVKIAKKAIGAKTDEHCPNCGEQEMTFNTAQLRSADEGQTVFFTCGACGHTYSLNS